MCNYNVNHTGNLGPGVSYRDAGDNLLASAERFEALAAAAEAVAKAGFSMWSVALIRTSSEITLSA
jgi:hypothetical protein